MALDFFLLQLKICNYPVLIVGGGIKRLLIGTILAEGSGGTGEVLGIIGDKLCNGFSMGKSLLNGILRSVILEMTPEI